MILKRGLLQIALAALLLVAQHGALTHPLRHLHDRLPVQTQQQNDGKKTSHSDLCYFHVSFAEILGAVNCAKLPLRIATNSVERGIHHFSPAYPSDLVVPASRGPPVLL
jgi:hypothetical protein